MGPFAILSVRVWATKYLQAWGNSFHMALWGPIWPFVLDSHWMDEFMAAWLFSPTAE